jgi:hypothetical protein
MARDAKGRFLAGTSGNPGGRPRRSHREVKQLCREAAMEVVHVLISTVYDDRARTGDRLKAAEIVLNFALGKPRRFDDSELDDRVLTPERVILDQISPELKAKLGWTNKIPASDTGDSSRKSD